MTLVALLALLVGAVVAIVLAACIAVLLIGGGAMRQHDRQESPSGVREGTAR